MKYGKLGRTNWEISEVGYGMWGMGGWTGSNDEESMRSLQLALFQDSEDGQVYKFRNIRIKELK